MFASELYQTVVEMSEQLPDLNDLFDEIIEVKKLDGQEGLSEYLCISEGTVSNLRTGKAKYSKTSLKKYLENGKNHEYYEKLKSYVGLNSERARKRNEIREDETTIIELGNARATFKSATALEKADLKKIFSELCEVQGFDAKLAHQPREP